MKKTYIKIFAGLCNRLFQYSYGKYLMAQGQDVRFIRADDGNTDILDIFDVGPDQNLFYTNAKNGKLKVNLLKFYAKYIARSYNIGFYQRPEYFDCINLKFKNACDYQSSPLYKKIIESDSVAVHIRGGDYVATENNCFSNICTAKYYAEAIKLVKKTHKKPLFIIFTNDIEYSKKLLLSAGVSQKDFIIADEISDKKYDDGYDLYLMSQCKSNIIANSTYSWVGAVLNRSQKKDVICPEHWFQSGYPSQDYLFYPDWIKVGSN